MTPGVDEGPVDQSRQARATPTLCLTSREGHRSGTLIVDP